MNNLKNFTLILIFIILISTLSLSGLIAQEITKTDYDVYLYQGKIHTFKELGPVLEDNQHAYRKYASALRIRKRARTNGLIAAGSAGVGVLAIIINPSTDQYCDLFCLSPGQGIFLVTVLGITPVFTTISLIQKIGESAKRKKAIKLFNQGVPIGYHDNTPSPELYLGQTQNGIGMILNF